MSDFDGPMLFLLLSDTRFFFLINRLPKILATLAAQRAAFDPAPTLAPWLVCVMGHYPLTTPETTGPYLVRPGAFARGTSGTVAASMRGEVERSSATCDVTDAAASVVEHLVARAALLNAGHDLERCLENAGVLRFWGAIRLASFDLHGPFDLVERERARVAVRASPNYFHPERNTGAAALDARRLFEELAYSGCDAGACGARAYTDERRECPVCLCDAGHSSRAVRLPCAHVFCEECIDAWLCAAPNATCPVCRTEPTERCSACGAWSRFVWRSGNSAYCAMCVPWGAGPMMGV